MRKESGILREESRSVSCSSSIVKKLPLEKALEKLSRAGFKWIEINRNHMAGRPSPERLDAFGLKVWAVHGALGGDAASVDEDARKKAAAAEAEAMRAAHLFAPCPYVLHYLNRANDPAVGEAYRKSIEALLACAEKERFVLAVETVPYKPEVNERYAGSSEVADFVRSFASASLKICVDLNHSNLNEDLQTAIANCAGLIATIHVSDNHGRREEHLVPGEGEIDFPSAFRALIRAGYSGPLNLEVNGEEERSLSRLIAMRRWAEETWVSA